MSAPAVTGAVFETEDRADLRASVRALLAKRAGSEAVRAATTSADGFDRDLWTTLTEQIGVAALPIPEELGGVGASWAETHVVMEELGSVLAPTPMLGSAVLAVAALLHSTDDAARERLLPELAGGTIGALCWADERGWSTPGVTANDGILSGTASYVLDGAAAEILLVLARDGDGVSLFEVDPATVTRRRVPTMDPTRPLSEVVFDGTAGQRISAPADIAERIRSTALVALSGEQVGAAQGALDRTVQYTKERVQFGRVIGSFQALKHRMADMYAQIETARSISYAAALSGAQAQVLAARVTCTDALEHVASETVQLHGGIAITWEHDAQLFFKRAQGSGQLFGPPRADLATAPLPG